MRMTSNGEAARHPSDEGTYYTERGTIVSLQGCAVVIRNKRVGTHSTRKFDYSAFSVVRTVAPLCSSTLRISPRFDRIVIDRTR